MDNVKHMEKDRRAQQSIVLENTSKAQNEKISYFSPVKKIKVNDHIDIAYIDEGNPTTDVLLFIHGVGTGVPAWEQNINELKLKYRCIALDLPGHGFSDKGDYSYSIDFYSDVVLSFITKLGLCNVTLIGHSLGSQVSVMAAIKESKLIKGLVLASPVGFEPYSTFEKQLLVSPLAMIVITGSAFHHNYLTQLIGFCNNMKEANELASKLTFDNCNAFTFGKVLQRTIESILYEEVRMMLHEISQPVLIIVGEHDMVSPYQYMHGQCYPDLIEREANKINKMRFACFSSCGHFVQIRKYDQFNREVNAFMSADIKV